MVAQQQLLDSLRQIGLNLYERKLWVALLSRGTSSAGELSKLAKVPHSRTYDVLESLADKGFVMIQTTKPIKYVAIEPAESLERAKKHLREETDIKVSRINQLQGSNIVKELEKIFKTGVDLVEPGEMTGSLKGRHALHTQLDTVFKSAKKKIHIVTTGDGLRELNAKHGEVLRKASNRGVKVRIAVHAGKEHGDAVSAAKSYADVRRLEKNHGRFAVADDSQVVVSLTNDSDVHPTQDFALWTQGEHAAGNTFGPLFDALWSGLNSA